MTDQALDAVESDPLERMIGILDEEEGEPPGDEPANEEPETEEESPEETEEEEAPKAEELETIVHNGEEKQLTKAELKELAQQGFDYTQKTQQLAEQRRYVEQQEQYVKQQAQFAAQFTDQIAQVKAVESQLKQYDAVEWSTWEAQLASLAATDPMQYMVEQSKYQAAQRQWNSTKEAYRTKLNELSQLQQQAQQTAAEQQAQRVTTEAQAMRQAIPEWKDPNRASAEWAEIDAWLVKAGYQAGTVNAIDDHRQIVAARKAMLYDKLMAQGKQKVATAPPPTAKPGSTAKPNTDGKKLRDALRSTGKADYAAKLIERML